MYYIHIYWGMGVWDLWRCECTLTSFMSDTGQSHQRGGNLNWENTSKRCSSREASRMFSSLVINLGGPSSLELVTPLVLSSLRKQVEQAMRSKPVSRTTPWCQHQLLLAFQSWLSSMMDYYVKEWVKGSFFCLLLAPTLK